MKLKIEKTLSKTVDCVETSTILCKPRFIKICNGVIEIQFSSETLNYSFNTDLVIKIYEDGV